MILLIAFILFLAYVWYKSNEEEYVYKTKRKKFMKEGKKVRYES